jgi:hypothetical protein
MVYNYLDMFFWQIRLLWTSFLIPLIFTIFVLGTTDVAVAQESDQIQKLWETPTQLDTPESVVYEPTEDVLFVSNMMENRMKRMDKDSSPRFHLVMGL